VDLRADAATVALTVTDNGIGIAEAGRRSGLTNQC
jgi:signal transduction histidine kinase